ncbi:hypothetical protein BDF14DRAFT_1745483 [Spinellus fusiger]|nr:hypothetical protein BDF14DRAFT_1745483 [Spinellus fusiger]
MPGPSSLPNDTGCESIAFSPHLWRQRRSYVHDCLRENKVTSVLDYGCGEAALLSYLIPVSPNHDDTPILRLAGIDVDTECVRTAIEECRPWERDKRELREHPLCVDIYQGSLHAVDRRFCEYEALVCAEVIEHLSSHVLSTFFQVTMGAYRPKLMIVTTPNAEYNVHFPQLRYGTVEATFRHDDHKFEWTRHEFETWCQQAAHQYGYSAAFDGIGIQVGKKYDPKIGHCTQVCVFKDISDTQPPTIETESHVLVSTIVYPHYTAPALSPEALLQEMHSFIKDLCLVCVRNEQMEEERQQTHAMSLVAETQEQTETEEPAWYTHWEEGMMDPPSLSARANGLVWCTHWEESAVDSPAPETEEREKRLSNTTDWKDNEGYTALS